MVRRPVGSKFQLVRRGSRADSLARGSGGMLPRDIFGILDHLRSFLVQFWGEITRFLLFVYSPRSKGVAPLRRNCDFARMYIALVLNKNVNLNRAHYTTQRAKTPLLALRSKLPFRKAKCFQTTWRGRGSAMVQVRWVQLDS